MFVPYNAGARDKGCCDVGGNGGLRVVMCY
jgi:hypothetical protein